MIMLNNNPLFEFRPCTYVNDPYVIAQNDRMVSINSALTVDLTGQVLCSDSLGFEFYSGIGGQVDFCPGVRHVQAGQIHYGAAVNHGRRAKNPRVVPYPSPGSGVVVTRGDIHYVVTEYGIAYVHGKSIRDRAMALIKHCPSRFSAMNSWRRPRNRATSIRTRSCPSVLYPKEYETYWTDKQGVEIPLQGR